MSTITEQIANGEHPVVKDKHAVVYWDDNDHCWCVAFVADYGNAKDTVRRWRKVLEEKAPSGKIMICRLVETIEWS